MERKVDEQITAQDHKDLIPIVGQILAEEVLSIDEVTATKIGRSVGSATAGIYLVTGLARTRGGENAWSAVVKALGVPEHSSSAAEEDPYRELEVYRSGVFAEVCGGVRAAKCYAVQPLDDLQLLWLEDLSSAPQPPWNTHQFLLAARNLGQFNAHWREEALPTWDWLSQSGFRANMTGNEGFQKTFERFPEQQDHPLMQIYSPATTAKKLMQLWEQCDELLVLAERTAKGICHLDCHNKNLFPINGSGGESYTIGIDWVKVGLSNLGIDIGHIIASSLAWHENTPVRARSLRDPMFEAYMLGLEDSGWSGSRDDVRQTYLTRLACEAIRHTALVSAGIENTEWRELMERFFGLSMEEICSRYNANLEFYFDCIDEALQLVAKS